MRPILQQEYRDYDRHAAARHTRHAGHLDAPGRREAVQHARLGTRLFPDQRRGPRHGASGRRHGPRPRPLPLALDLNAQGIGFPLLLRFSDILKARIGELADRVRHAIEEHQYEGTYTTVYPIKVNQQRHVVEEIVEFGAEFGVGLECGSKPELQAVLGLSERTDHLIVCNGYKDEEFMRLALMGQRLGPPGLHRAGAAAASSTLSSRVADEIGVEPNLGVRIKLATEGCRPLGQERRREVEVRPVGAVS